MIHDQAVASPPTGAPAARRRKLQTEPDDAAGRNGRRQAALPPPPAKVPTDRGNDDHDEPTPFGRLCELLRPEWPDLWIVIVFAVVVGLLALATPVAVEALVNTVAFGRFLQPVVVLALVLFTFLFMAALTRALQTYVVEIIQRRLFARVVGDLAWRLPRVKQSVHDEHDVPELANRFFDIVTVQKSVAQLLLDGIAIVVGTVVGMTVLAFYHPLLLGFDLVLLALVTFTIFVLGRGAVASSIKESKAKYRNAGWLEEITRSPVAFRTAGAAALTLSRADRHVADYLTCRSKHFRALMRQVLFALILQAVGSTLLLGLGGWLVIKGQLTLGQLVAAELIVAVILGSFAKLGKHLESFYDLLAAVDKLGILFDLPIEAQSGIAELEPGAKLPVRIRGVQLAPDREPLNLSVEPGERVALERGAESRFLLDALYGARPLLSGHAEIGGIDCRDVRPEDLRRHVALVRQPEIFGGTVAENVRLGRTELSHGDIRDCLERVGLLDRILSLPLGLQTVLISGGSCLTDDEARLLTLARALAGRPTLLLIDGLLDGLSDAGLRSALEAISACEGSVIVATGQQRVADGCTRRVSLRG